MPTYRIHRLQESHRKRFRWKPHTAGTTVANRTEYAIGSMVESESPYAAWLALRTTSEALQVGDILESPDGTLRICKYVGFEEARWSIPEPASQTQPSES